jgi:hypothetical protein
MSRYQDTAIITHCSLHRVLCKHLAGGLRQYINSFSAHIRVYVDVERCSERIITIKNSMASVRKRTIPTD